MDVATGTHYLDVEGGRLAYDERGAGHPLVLLHEGIADRRMWDPEFDRLAQRYRAVRYDLRGYGASSKAKGPFSHVDDLGRMLDHLGDAPAVVVGPSMGGRIAIDYALDHPERVAGLFLVAPGLSGMQVEYDPEGADAYAADDRDSTAVQVAWTAGRKEEAFDRLRALWGAALAGPALDRFREMIRANEQEVFESVSDRLDHLDGPTAAQRLGRLKVPVKVVVGDRDNPSMPRFAGYIAHHVPGATLETIPGGDHLLNLSRPVEFSASLDGFLAGLAAR